jgi:GNAT superfamily N-acetyltransferase
MGHRRRATAEQHIRSEGSRFEWRGASGDKDEEKGRALKQATKIAEAAAMISDGVSVMIGGGGYIVMQPQQAEVAFAVIDEYQGQGVGAALMRHVAAIAREAGLRELIAEVLTNNTGMLKVFEKGGFPLQIARSAGVIHIALRIA